IPKRLWAPQYCRLRLVTHPNLEGTAHPCSAHTVLWEMLPLAPPSPLASPGAVGFRLATALLATRTAGFPSTSGANVAPAAAAAAHLPPAAPSNRYRAAPSSPSTAWLRFQPRAAGSMMASLLQCGLRRPPAADHGGSSLPLRSGAKGDLYPYVYHLGFGCRRRSRRRSRCRSRRLLLLNGLELAEKCEVHHALGLVPLAEHPQSAGEAEAPGREARGR
ncbi:unnamed protein product, partial [Ectocarpus sp. 8 AP-2014]